MSEHPDGTDSAAVSSDARRVLVPLDNLSPGWIVDSDIWSGSNLLLSAGVEITPRIIQRLKDRGIQQIQVSANSELALKDHRQAPVDPLAHLLQAAGQVYQQHGLETAIPLEILEGATEQVEGFFQEIENGEALDQEAARSMVHTLVELFTARSNLAVKLLDLESVDHYTYRHSLNVGMLFMSIASDWVGSQEELEDLVFGAVLHDLGKAQVGAAIINKPGKLDEAEWEIMRKHTIWSAEMLQDSGASPNAISIARSHHERLDGRGYPDGLTEAQLTPWAKLSTICDVYDALTTKRSYKFKMDFAKAIDIIIQDCGKAFDAKIAHNFITKIGRYPVGSFVWLSSGEVAVVIEVNERAVSRPIVSRVLNADRSPRTEPERLDLTENLQLHITGLAGEIDPSQSSAASA